jgi:hypothetical protein
MNQRQIIVLAALLATSAVASFGQSASGKQKAVKQGAIVKETFVFIYRQGARKLSDEEQKRRSEEVRAWATRQNSEGRKLDPRILGDENYSVGLESDGTDAANRDGRLIAIVFIEANDFSEAVKIAKTHPGIRYGVSIEVRPWGRPAPVPATAQQN